MVPLADGQDGRRWKKSEGSERRRRWKKDWKEKSNRKGYTSNQWIIFAHFLVILWPVKTSYSPTPHEKHLKRIEFYKSACYSIVNARVTCAPKHCPLQSVHHTTVTIATTEEGDRIPTGHNWTDCSILQRYGAHFKRIVTGSGRPSAHYWMMSSEKTESHQECVGKRFTAPDVIHHRDVYFYTHTGVLFDTHFSLV